MAKKLITLPGKSKKTTPAIIKEIPKKIPKDFIFSKPFIISLPHI
jgi:hypothetical protein